VPVRDTRAIGKRHMVENDATPAIEVDPRTFAVRIDGALVEEDPVTSLPLAQLYSLF
jgi:urease subunit alpha